MATMYQILKNISLPQIARVQCEFDRSEVSNVSEAVQSELRRKEIAECIKPGMRIAVGVGSRGLASLPEMTKALIDELILRGAKPFVVPTMGSHGGATAEGQEKILASLGITEDTMGCPICSSMETVELGEIAVPELNVTTHVYFDKNAYQADGIVMVARVKPHPAFKDAVESGMLKMLAIGFGKQRGAQAYHTAANGRMGRVVEAVASHNIRTCKVLFALGTVENAYDRVCDVRAVLAKDMVEVDKEMLIEAKQRIGHLPFDRLDVLIAKQMGKEISGEGLDPNITGRRATGHLDGGPQITRIGVLELTPESDGNVVGIGAVDVITEKLQKRINFDISYANALTTGGLPNVRMPMVLKNDWEVFAAATHSAKLLDTTKARLVLIRDTLHLSSIYISKALAEEVKQSQNVIIETAFEDIRFDADGNLAMDI